MNMNMSMDMESNMDMAMNGTDTEPVCDSANLKKKHIYPKGSYGLFLTCR
jgi:hypothetical protein